PLVGLNHFTVPRAIVDLRTDDPRDIILFGGLTANAATELCTPGFRCEPMACGLFVDFASQASLMREKRTPLGVYLAGPREPSSKKNATAKRLRSVNPSGPYLVMSGREQAACPPTGGRQDIARLPHAAHPPPGASILHCNRGIFARSGKARTGRAFAGSAQKAN